MELHYSLCTLSTSFYEAYPEEKYPEVLRKESRPYTCLIIESAYDFSICIPFRTEMHHKNGYKFRKSRRSRYHQSGLDYSKIVIIRDRQFICASPAIVDKDEYVEMVSNIKRIAREAQNYISTYTNHVSGAKTLDANEFRLRYNCSTLPYFHQELGLQDGISSTS